MDQGLSPPTPPPHREGLENKRERTRKRDSVPSGSELSSSGSATL